MSKPGEEYFVFIGHQKIPVTKEQYTELIRWKERQRHYARRDGKCGQSDYKKCSGNCDHCPWYQEGFRFLPYEKAFKGGITDVPDHNGRSAEDIACDRISCEELICLLNTLVSCAGDIAKLLAKGCSQREASAQLRMPQSTLGSKLKLARERLKKDFGV